MHTHTRVLTAIEERDYEKREKGGYMEEFGRDKREGEMMGLYCNLKN